MKNIFKIAAMLLIFAGSFISCGDKEESATATIWECIISGPSVTITLNITQNGRIATVKTSPKDLSSAHPEWMFLLHNGTQYIVHENTFCPIKSESNCFTKTMLSPDSMVLEYTGLLPGYAQLISTYRFKLKE